MAVQRKGWQLDRVWEDFHAPGDPGQCLVVPAVGNQEFRDAHIIMRRACLLREHGDDSVSTAFGTGQ
jgi:hypothetical protein